MVGLVGLALTIKNKFISGIILSIFCILIGLNTLFNIIERKTALLIIFIAIIPTTIYMFYESDKKRKQGIRIVGFDKKWRWILLILLFIFIVLRIFYFDKMYIVN